MLNEIISFFKYDPQMPFLSSLAIGLGCIMAIGLPILIFFVIKEHRKERVRKAVEAMIQQAYADLRAKEKGQLLTRNERDTAKDEFIAALGKAANKAEKAKDYFLVSMVLTQMQGHKNRHSMREDVLEFSDESES